MATSSSNPQALAFCAACLGLTLQSAHGSETVNVAQTTDTITVDGVLDEAAWQNAIPVTEFVRFIPTDGGAPSGQTDVRFLQDKDTLYIGIKVRQTNYPIQARVSPREDVNDDDQIGIYIDTVGDGRTGYIFYFNPIGIQQDMRYSNGRWMMEWNTIYESKGVAEDNGFTLEVSIPFRSLQYPDSQPNWKVMLTRKIPSEGAKYSYPKMRRNHPQMFNQALPMTGIQPPKAGAGIWVQPTISGRHVMLREEADAPLEWTGIDPWIDTVRPSMDFRWGFTPDTAMTITTNPDFSQVEGDVRQVNLNQRFAFYYPERRPFFLSNIDSFQDNADILYTRSIVNPISGAKLAGQEGKWDFGVLHGLDQNPNPSVHEFGAVGFSEEEVSGHLSSTSYLRLRKAALNSGFIGFYAADKRILDAESPFYTEDIAPATGSFNDVMGIDIRSNFGQYGTITTASVGSIVGNDTDTEMGAAQSIAIRRTPDLGLGFSLSGGASSQEYRKEMGFLNQSGLKTGSGDLFYLSQIGSNSLLRSKVEASVKQEFDDDQYWEVNQMQSLRLNGLHNIGLETGWSNERYKETTVAGPYVNLSWLARLSNKVSTKLYFSYKTPLDYASLQKARDYSTTAVLLWRPVSNLRIDCDFIQQWYELPDQPLQSIQRIYNRINWQFSPYLGTRLIQQSVLSSDTDVPSLFLSALLSYIRNPGNEFYLGGTWNVYGETTLDLNEQMLFVKWTHLFQY